MLDLFGPVLSKAAKAIAGFLSLLPPILLQLFLVSWYWSAVELLFFRWHSWLVFVQATPGREDGKTKDEKVTWYITFCETVGRTAPKPTHFWF